MYDISRFGLRAMTECEAAVRRMGAGASCMEQAADRIVRFLYDNLVDGDSGAKACVLVRCFKTNLLAQLPPDLAALARRTLAGRDERPDMKCLTLLATAGAEPEWNSRRASVAHQAIPLESEQLVLQAPMISNLIRQFGLEISTVLQPDPELLIDLAQKSYNVFHVPEADGSPYVPAQDNFVHRYHVQSVLGFGGMFPTGNLFAIILFTNTLVAREAAEMFRSLALAAKVALLPFDRGPIFEDTAKPAEELQYAGQSGPM